MADHTHYRTSTASITGSPQQPGPSSEAKKHALIGAVLGGLGGATIAAAVFWALIRRRRQIIYSKVVEPEPYELTSREFAPPFSYLESAYTDIQLATEEQPSSRQSSKALYMHRSESDVPLEIGHSPLFGPLSLLQLSL